MRQAEQLKADDQGERRHGDPPFAVSARPAAYSDRR